MRSGRVVEWQSGTVAQWHSGQSVWEVKCVAVVSLSEVAGMVARTWCKQAKQSDRQLTSAT